MPLRLVGSRREASTGQELGIWRVVGEAAWKHVEDYRRWQVIPSTACSPKQFRAWVVGGPYQPGVCLAQTAPPVDMLRFVFASGQVTLNHNELKDLADLLRIDITGSRGSKAAVLHALAVNIAAADGLVSATKFADEVMAKFTDSATATDTFVDPSLSKPSTCWTPANRRSSRTSGKN